MGDGDIWTFESLRDQFPATTRFQRAADIVADYLTEGSSARQRALGRAEGEAGKIDFEDWLFGIEETYQTKGSDLVRWEAHTEWTDVQIILAGEEIIEVIDQRGLILAEDARPELDIQFFEAQPGGSRLHLSEGSVAVLTPRDAHGPGLAVSGPARVCKVVLKLRV